MAASADIFTEREDWRRPLGWSVAFHGFLLGGILLYGALFGRFTGEGWGGDVAGGGGAMSATLVASIPLPASAVQTPNIVAHESKGLSKSIPAVEEPAPTDAIPIPEKETRRKPPRRPRPTPSQEKAEPTEEASNVVPFGEGGPISGPYGVFSVSNAKGGFGFTGGGGDFGSRYAWYVRVVQQKVSENWLKYEIDPSIRDARRVYLTFDINRAGHPDNIQIESSSGVPSLDQSAMRALQRIDSFGPLPSDYPGSSVSVEFWFDYHR